MKSYKYTLFISLILVTFDCIAEDVSALKIMDKVKDKYLSISQYQDIGVVEIVTTSLVRGSQSTRKINFTTSFRRNGEFNIEWMEEVPVLGVMTYKIHKTGNEVLRVSPFGETKKYEDLSIIVCLTNLLPITDLCEFENKSVSLINYDGNEYIIDVQKNNSVDRYSIDVDSYIIKQLEWTNEGDDFKFHHILKINNAKINDV